MPFLGELGQTASSSRQLLLCPGPPEPRRQPPGSARSPDCQHVGTSLSQGDSMPRQQPEAGPGRTPTLHVPLSSSGQTGKGRRDAATGTATQRVFQKCRCPETRGDPTTACRTTCPSAGTWSPRGHRTSMRGQHRHQQLSMSATNLTRAPAKGGLKTEAAHQLSFSH